MPTPQYTALANITLASTATEVVFDSISQEYRDLVLVTNASIGSGTGSMFIKMNADNSSATYWIVMSSDGSNTPLSQSADWVYMYTTYAHYNLTTTPSAISTNIMDYRATDKHKTFLIRSATPNNSVSALAGRWSSTAAITKLTCQPTASSFAVGSTFALYGVK